METDSKERKMTPLEMALNKKKRCNDTTIVNGVLYCNKSGKIILPMFTENEENKVCAIKKCRNLQGVTETV